MTMTFSKAARFALLLVIPGLVLAGCGRKGDLDRPGANTPINTKTPTGTPEPRQRVEDRPFLLDPLL
nr:lipoprotein [Ensifer aridi]